MAPRKHADVSKTRNPSGTPGTLPGTLRTPRNPAKYSPRTFAGVFARAFKTIDAMTLMNEIKKVIVRDIVRFTTFLLQIWIAKFIIILLTRLNI
jgi:hypothetical protein